MRKCILGIFLITIFVSTTVFADTAANITSMTAPNAVTPTQTVANNSTATVNQTVIPQPDRIAVLENNTMVMQAQISALSQKVNELDQELQHFKIAQNSLLSQILAANNIKAWLSILSAAIIIIFLLTILQWIFSATKKPHGMKTTAKDDFDLMGATEGIAAKLNLARAYLDMQNKDAAKVLLQEVIAAGTPEQQQEARGLLEKL